MKWNSRQVGNVTVVDAAGRITIGEGANQLRDTIRELVTSGRRNLVLNMAATTYLDSSGIGELVAALTAAMTQGGSLKLLNISKRIQDMLQLTRVDKLFQAFTDEAAAVNSFENA